MFWILPDWLCFYVGLAAVLITICKLVSRFIKRPYDLYERYGGGWAVVTGGSDGIGLGFCEQLTKLGFNICIISRNKHKINKVLHHLKQMNNNIQTRAVVADFGHSLEPGFYDKLIKEIQDLDISILVNNVGVLSQIGPFHKLTVEEIYNQCTINMIPAAMMTRLLMPQMMARSKHSGIIFLSSFSTFMRLKNSAGYCATKLFNDRLGQALNYQYRGKIDILSLKPGLVSTQMTKNTKSLVHVNKNQCAKGALKSLGRYEVYAGSWWQELQSFGIELLNQPLRDVATGYTWHKIGVIYKEIDSKKKLGQTEKK